MGKGFERTGLWGGHSLGNSDAGVQWEEQISKEHFWLLLAQSVDAEVDERHQARGSILVLE